jgi:hypothetical protein
MVTIPHSVNFVTELDESHPIVQRLLNNVENPSKFLADMLAELLISEGFLDKLNEGNSYATLKVVK